MKLAVRKEQGAVPGGGFHYMLVPKPMDSDAEAAIWELMGHVIIEVPTEKAARLLKEAGAALTHQVEVATLTERTLKEEEPK